MTATGSVPSSTPAAARDLRRFEGKVAIVTGGSKGIGRGIAVRLASEGARVAFTWCRDRDAKEDVVAEMRELGCEPIVVRTLMKDPHAPEKIVEAVRAEAGEPHLLVSNVASGVPAPISEATESHWQWAMETNALALLRFMKAAPSLEAVVAMSSIGGPKVLVGYGTIGVSKAALESLVRYLAVELAPRCRVNAISSTVVDTASLRAFPRSQEIIERVQEATPAGRLVEPEDVAGLASFLLSDDALMITGQTLMVDGGYSALGYTGMAPGDWLW